MCKKFIRGNIVREIRKAPEEGKRAIGAQFMSDPE